MTSHAIDMGRRTEVEDVFAQADCRGWLCVQSADPVREVEVRADDPVVAASVIKVLIAVAAEAAFARGDLDPERRLTLSAAGRTPGPVGFSLFCDDVTVSGRDLVSAMLTISDNVAADALLGLVGLHRTNELAHDLGLTGTVIVSDLATMIDSVARAAGFADWAAMTRWSESHPTPAARERVDAGIRGAAALDPTRATRTTAQDMCRLLRLIWEDRAGPAEACGRVRGHLGRQLTRNRLAAGFPPSARVAAKSGGLLGIVRNEIGVIEDPAGRRHYAAVFTRSAGAAGGDAEVNAAIGRAAAVAVSALSFYPS